MNSAARIILLLATFVLPIVCLSGKSVTADEIAHLPATIAIFGDYSLFSAFASAHCVARARAWMTLQYGDGPENWLARASEHGGRECLLHL